MLEIHSRNDIFHELRNSFFQYRFLPVRMMKSVNLLFCNGVRSGRENWNKNNIDYLYGLHILSCTADYRCERSRDVFVVFF